MKIEELKRRYTGPIGCPSDTKDPDYWDWDNWDNWPEEDKEMFPIEEKRAMKEGISSDTLYDRICRSLTDYEHNGEEETGFEELSENYFEDDFFNLLDEVFKKSDIQSFDGYLYNKIDSILGDYSSGAPVTADELHDLLVEVKDAFADANVQNNFNESVKRTGKSLREDVSFIDRWHDTHEILPDCDNVWFIADGKIYVGLYEPEQQIFCMADGLGVELKDVRQWKFLADKEIIGYPKEKEIVAIEVPDFPCPVTGIFSDHLVDEETGDEFSGVILDDEYQFCEIGADSIHWEKVFSWYHLPDEPLKILDVDEVKVAPVETVASNPAENTPNEEDKDRSTEELNPADHPELSTDAYVGAKADERITDTNPDSYVNGDNFVDETIDSEGPDLSSGSETVPETVAEEAEEQVPAAEATSAIAEQKPEEEKLVRESFEKKEVNLEDVKVKPWYMEEYPTDEMGEDIDDDLTFEDIFQCLDSYDDIYKYIPGDSIIRERIFSKLAELMDVDYDYIYDQWLKSADIPSSWMKAFGLNESIRGNTRQFVDNVEEYLEEFGDDIWERLRVNIQYLQEYARYGTLNEAIREYIEGGSLDVYYDEVRKTLNELYENTPEEVEKWADYPTDKLWERYINVMCLYIPKAYKKHTGKELDMRKDPESEYSQKVRAKYGENKLSVCESLRERGLTRAERHNRSMDRIFGFKRAIDAKQCKFMLDHGVDRDKVDSARKNDRVGKLLADEGLHDDFWKSYKESTKAVKSAIKESKEESLAESQDNIIKYKGYLIEKDFYGQGEYTVQYMGDDVWFETLDAAKEFIDDIYDVESIEEKKIRENLEQISDRAYGQWVALKNKMGDEYLADYVIDQLPKHEAELIIDYLADINGIEVNEDGNNLEHGFLG
jgi:hypothetical protein